MSDPLKLTVHTSRKAPRALIAASAVALSFGLFAAAAPVVAAPGPAFASRAKVSKRTASLPRMWATGATRKPTASITASLSRRTGIRAIRTTPSSPACRMAAATRFWSFSGGFRRPIGRPACGISKFAGEVRGFGFVTPRRHPPARSKELRPSARAGQRDSLGPDRCRGREARPRRLPPRPSR